jgi:prepilin-type N-terminal cleavage/methylation domain-containing protein
MNMNKGFGLVEILVGVAIISIVFPAVYLMAASAVTSVHASVRHVEAAYLAQEGIEAVRVIRSGGWEDTIVPLSLGTEYYPVIDNDKWTLSTTDPGLINGVFTRTVTVHAVLRDANDNIATSGTTDEYTRRITVTVSWSERTGPREVVLETYLTNFLGS